MRIATLVLGDRRVLGVERPDGFVDLSKLGLPAELGALLRNAFGPSTSAGLAEIAAAVAAAPASAVIDEATVRYLPPIADGAKILCLGLNYVAHAKEASYERPKYPVIFTRYASSFVGHGEPLELPSTSSSFDYEAELVAVIGKGGRHIPAERALEHVMGYTLMNDGSVRDVQVHTHQWVLGKNFDRSGSLGPAIVTADELPPGGRDLAIQGRLDGQVMQTATTSDMVFDVASTIAYVSIAMALAPGDLIAMGTPAGVGNARTPKVFLTPANTFEVEVERVGVLRNSVRPEVV
jgi:acylpyruvate hydrolase